MARKVEFCIIRTEIKALHVRCGEIGKLDTSKGGDIVEVQCTTSE